MFQCNWPPVSVEMTIPKSQQLCAEIQVGMTQEAQEQPDEMGWCLTKKVFVNLPWKCVALCKSWSSLQLHYLPPVRPSAPLSLSYPYSNRVKRKVKSSQESDGGSMVALRLSIMRDHGGPLTEKERSDLWKMGSIHWETEKWLITN